MKWVLRKLAAHKAAVLAASVVLAAVYPTASDVITTAVKTVEAAAQLVDATDREEK